jgi:thiamine biosynthesis lipoprotein
MRTPRLIVLGLAALLLVATFLGADRGAVLRHEFRLLGWPAQVEVRDVDPALFERVVGELGRELHRMDTQWHPWKPSELVRANQALAARGEATLPESMRVPLRRALVLRETSGGLFEPAVGGLVGLWGFHTDTYPIPTPPPTPAAVRAWREQAVGAAVLTIDGERLRSDNRGVRLDLSAVIEGMAAETLARRLRSAGMDQALVSFGGDAYAVGDGGGRPWLVELRDPFGGVFGRIELADGEAFFNAGSYDRYREAPNGTRWGYILDPRTGYPTHGGAATAVLHDDPMLADAAAIALMVGGPAEFEATVRRMGLGCALMITEENELLITTRMQQRFRADRQPVLLGQPIDLGSDCRAQPRLPEPPPVEEPMEP